ALKSRATIVPMYFKAPIKWFHRVQISIYPPIDISDIKKVDASAMQTIDDRMRRGIWGERAYLPKAETPR
ncbi:MAG: hypothetical protein IJJ23_09360, partial [Clostridia bacterium]|nr:hypothetical protein [Clostridia bacterium]